MEFLNSFQSAATAAKFAMADTLIGISVSQGANPQVKNYQPEYLDYCDEAAVSAATSRTLAGKRVFVKGVRNFQGLAFRRLPVVATSTRVHNWCMCFAPANALEAFESVVAAYTVGQDRKVMMPSCVVIDELLQETYESLDFPGSAVVKNTVGDLKIDKKHADFSRCDLEGIALMNKAVKNAHAFLKDFSESWKKKTKSHFKLVETQNLEDAEFAIVTYGSATTNAKLAVKHLREQRKEKVGLLSLKLIRPFPEQEVSEALKNVKKIAVVDNTFSLATWSRLYQEVRTCHNGLALNAMSENTTVKNFIEIFDILKKSEKSDRIWNF